MKLNRILQIIVVVLLFAHPAQTIHKKGKQVEPQKLELIPVRELLKADPEFNEATYSKLLTMTGRGGEKLTALFLSNINNLMDSLHHDFPDSISLGNIGQSFQQRPIRLMTVDGRKTVTKDLQKEPITAANVDLSKDYYAAQDRYLKSHYLAKPAILITGQHHSREVITSSMVLYSVLKMLHGELHGNDRYSKLLAQNKYYVIPTVNVDGLNYIEQQYYKTGHLKAKRTNMHVQSKKCSLTEAGVDLNRNYGYKWGVGNSKDGECVGETYHGTAPFSEPETRAMRDFLIKKQKEIKFVYNFHCAGNQFILPYNGELPNKLATEQPDTKKFFQELIQESTFADGYDIGPSTETIGIVAGGDAGDWINHALGIMAAEAELGKWSAYNEQWFPRTESNAFTIVNENLNWLEYTYEKLGNQLKIEAIGYKKLPTNAAGENKAVFQIRVTNQGLSDQIHDDIRVRLGNRLIQVDPPNAGAKNLQIFNQKLQLADSKLSNFARAEDKIEAPLERDHVKENFFFINGLKKRSSQIYNIPVELRSPPGHDGFYNNYEQPLETTLEFDEFITSESSKNEFVVFKHMK